MRRAAAATSSIAASRCGAARCSSAPRRPADRARRQDRPAGVGDAHRRSGARLHHHRRAAGGEGQGDHRQWRRRVRRARLRHRLRRRDRQAGLALLHRARQSDGRLREQDRRDDRAGPGPASGGNRAAAARSGTRWPTIRSSTCSISASATARPGARSCARRARATICSSPRSSRSGRTPANTSGTTRPRRATTGTTPPPST